MQKKKNYVAIFAIVMTALFLVVGSVALFKPDKEVIPEGYVSELEMNSAISGAMVPKDAKILELTEQLAIKVVEEVEETAEEIKEAFGYLIDEIFFNEELDEELSDREIEKLLDSEIKFDGEDYDLEEVIVLNGMEVLCNEEDFKGECYLVVPSETIEYSVVFDSKLNTSLIEPEETLVFNFLGNEVEVSEWNVNEVTFSQGEEVLMDQGESKTVNGKVVTIIYVMEESIFVDVDGETEEIDEGKLRTVNGIEIEVKNIIYSEVGPVTKAIVVLGEEVEVEVRDGEEYAEDSIWEYAISADSIGLVLSEEFMELDDELKPLAAGEMICLPNDYVCMKFNGVLEEDFEEISMELDTIESLEYVEVEGNFVDGLEDYDKLYINSSGIYDEDLELIGTEVGIGNSDLELKLVSNKIKINDVKIFLDLDMVKVAGVDISSEEDDFRNDYGILVMSPEDSVEDNEFNLMVPENKLESTITVM